MEAATTPAITRLQILEDALRLARLRGAVKDGCNLYELPEEDGSNGRYEPSTAELASYSHKREKVCGVCLAGAIYLAQLEHGINPLTNQGVELYDAFEDLRPFAKQAARELEVNDAHLFSAAITVGGLPYIERTLELAIDNERERVKAAV